MNVERRLDELNLRLEQIEERLSILEHRRLEHAGMIPPEIPAMQSPVIESEANGEEESFLPGVDLALIGKSLLILGGAFLLRAATDSMAVSKPVGVALGILYALVWIGAALHSVRLGRRSAGVFYAVTAAIIAYPIVWEATTRFGVMTANMAAVLLAVLSIGLIEAGRRYSFASFAWIAAAGATCNALLLAVATKQVVPFLIELTVVGAAAFLLHANVVGWVLALESDLVALLLFLATVLDSSSDGRFVVAAALLGFAGIWIAVSRPAMMQAALGTLLGVAGSAALVLPARDCAIVWSLAAVIAAEIARRGATRAVTIPFAVQSAVWTILAAARGGLFAFAGAALLNRGERLEVPLLVVVVAALSLAAFFRHRNVVLLGTAICGVTALALVGVSAPIGTAGESVHALLHTAVLSMVAVALAAIGRLWRVREASQLAVALLVLTGAKVVLQDLRTGTAAVMFIALGVYGGAMLGIARLRRVVPIS